LVGYVLKERVKAEFNVRCNLKFSLESMEGKSEFNFTFGEAEVEVIDKDDGNRFLKISSVGSDNFKVEIITSTESLSRILKAACGWEKSLGEWIERLDKEKESR